MCPPSLGFFQRQSDFQIWRNLTCQSSEQTLTQNLLPVYSQRRSVFICLLSHLPLEKATSEASFCFNYFPFPPLSLYFLLLNICSLFRVYSLLISMFFNTECAHLYLYLWSLCCIFLRSTCWKVISDINCALQFDKWFQWAVARCSDYISDRTESWCYLFFCWGVHTN